jgi:hypothetical protein
MALKSELLWLDHEVKKREGKRPYVNLGTGKRSQCPTCWEIFSTESNFDRHRKGRHSERRFCVSPEAVGLIRKANGDWGMPPSEDRTPPEGG